MERNRIKTAEYRKLNYERVRARERASQERLTLEQRKQRSLRYNLWHQYGMTISDYLALVKLQEGACAICHSLPQKARGFTSIIATQLARFAGFSVKGVTKA